MPNRSHRAEEYNTELKKYIEMFNIRQCKAVERINDLEFT